MNSREMMRITGIAPFDLDNYVRHHQLAPSLKNGLRAFSLCDAVKGFILNRTKGMMLPTLASRMGDAVYKSLSASDAWSRPSRLVIYHDGEGFVVSDGVPPNSIGLAIDCQEIIEFFYAEPALESHQ